MKYLLISIFLLIPKVLKHFVSLTQWIFGSGSRTRKRDTFFCLASYRDVANAEIAGAFFCQRKYPKKRRPYAAYFLRSPILQGIAERDVPIPSAMRGIPAAPLRANPSKICDTRRGIRERLLLDRIAYLIVCWLCLCSYSLYAVDIYQLPDPEQQKTYESLTQELRCLVCQNQNIADSNAELAGDLRRQVFEMLQQGKSKDEIVTFMTDRYGDFVLYNPPLKAKTGLLWLGPVLFLLTGLALVFWLIRRRKQAPATEMNAERQAEIRKLLNEDDV